MTTTSNPLLTSEVATLWTRWSVLKSLLTEIITFFNLYLINEYKAINLKTNYISNMNIVNSKSLTEHNTFKVDSIAEFFIAIKSEKELIELINATKFKKKKKFVLGGGSLFISR